MAAPKPRPRYRERARADYLTGQELVSQLGNYLGARYQEAETYLLTQIARRAAADLATDRLEARVASIEALHAEALKAIAAIDSESEARRIVEIATREGETAAIEVMGFTKEAAGWTAPAAGPLAGQVLPFSTGLTSTGALASATLGRQLSTALADVNSRILRTVPDVYQQTIAKAATAKVLGVVTQREAQRKAVVDFLSSGIDGFTDAAGRNWTIGSYTEMATRTATHSAWNAAHMARFQAQGITLMQIQVGSNACQKCGDWAGRILTMGGQVGAITVASAVGGAPEVIVVDATVNEAQASGWDHPNCRCSLAPFFAGVTVPDGSTTYDPQGAKDEADLRYLERRVRDFKRRAQLAQAVGDDRLAADYAARGRAEQARIRAQVARTGQVRKPYREALSFADGAPSKLPPIAPKAVEP